MTLRNLALIGFSGLCIVTAVAGHASEPTEAQTDQLLQLDSTLSSCMIDGFDTPEGRVGCFEPVIAVIDESFFEQNAAIVEDAAAE